ncbi:MAG: hypothetical protein J6Q57_06230 [Paraprevotella sp.]|jgi:hypothetical protein|nr:hypothetical protein [Paraprevotella sp.]
MAAKKYMTSYYVLYACFAIIILTFAVFFGYGYDNMEGDYNAPVCTEGLMWLMYGMFAVTAILAVWSVVRGAKISMATKGGDISGVPGGKVTAASMALLVISLIVGLVPNLNETEFVAADGTVTTAAMVTVTDMFMVSIYIMLLLTTLAVVFNMTGLMKKKK